VQGFSTMRMTSDKAWQGEHDPWKIAIGDGPVVATAIHAGHDVRPAIAKYMSLTEQERRREEDPLTGFWTSVGDSSVTVFRSRFEFDLNRPREAAIATNPEAAWGLSVWKELPPQALLEQSLAAYDAFYAQIQALLDDLASSGQRILVLDLHSYNHRREGPDLPAAASENPDINIGTGTMNRNLWCDLVDTFIDTLRSVHVQDRLLDVRENIRFRGGYFPAWLHTHYPHQVCTLSIECKKIFMDEWTAQADIAYLDDLRAALLAATAAAREVLLRADRSARPRP
jgi:N-formylglutamate deformylase